MPDLTPAAWGSRTADLEVLEFIRAALQRMDLSRPAQGAALHTDDAAFLAAKRARLEGMARKLEGVG